MAEQSDHDILVRNTTLTEQMAKQLNDALGQLVRGNERFAQQDARIERTDSRVDRLEERLETGAAQLRSDLLRAVIQSAELKKDSTEEVVRSAITPIKADLQPIKEVFVQARAFAARAIRLLKWLIYIGTALLIAYLVSAWGLR